MEPHGNGGSQTTGGDGGQRIYEQGKQVHADARAMADDFRGVTDELTSMLRSHVEQRPYVTLGAAAAMGYVLGGGLPRWMVKLGFAVGGRMLVDRLLTDVFAESEPLETVPPPTETL